jgi:hypothetical protein
MKTEWRGRDDDMADFVVVDSFEHAALVHVRVSADVSGAMVRIIGRGNRLVAAQYMSFSPSGHGTAVRWSFSFCHLKKGRGDEFDRL